MSRDRKKTKTKNPAKTEINFDIGKKYLTVA